MNLLFKIILLQATTISLSELMNQKGQVPYTKSLKVKVIAREKEFSYKNEKNEDRVLVNCAVADKSTAIKCTVYDASKFPRFTEGKSIILRNIIKKVDAVMVTINTKVFPCGDVGVPNEIVRKAQIILNPPPAPTKPVSEALNSPPKVRVSIKGRIMQVRLISFILFLAFQFITEDCMYLFVCLLNVKLLNLWNKLFIECYLISYLACFYTFTVNFMYIVIVILSSS